MTQSKPKRKMRVKQLTCTPTKAELREVVVLRKSDGPVPTLEEVIKAAFCPAKVVTDPGAWASGATFV